MQIRRTLLGARSGSHVIPANEWMNPALCTTRAAARRSGARRVARAASRAGGRGGLTLDRPIAGVGPDVRRGELEAIAPSRDPVLVRRQLR